MRRGAVGLAFLVGLVAAGESSARELWSRGDFALQFSGSLQELALGTSETDQDDFLRAAARDPDCLLAETFESCDGFDEVGEKDVFQSRTRLRTRFDLELGKHVTGLVIYDLQLFGGHLDTFASSLAENIADDTFIGAEDNLHRGDTVAVRQSLYRGYLAFEAGPAELVVGRQRVAWGVAKLWNPIDRFNPISPLALDADQSQGIDGVAARWNLDGFNFFEAVYAPGTSRDEARMALRFHGVVFDTDVSLMGGRIQRAPTFGLDVSRNLGEAAIGIEVVYTKPERRVRPIGASKARKPGEYWQIVASIDRNFAIGDGVYVLLEHLYNGNALGFGRGKAGPFLNAFEETDSPIGPVPVPGDVSRFAGSGVVSGARHQTGLDIATDITPEIRADLLTLYDWNGTSAIFYPSLFWNPTSWAEIRLGVQVPVGSRRSEYGSGEVLGFVLTEFFF